MKVYLKPAQFQRCQELSLRYDTLKDAAILNDLALHLQRAAVENGGYFDIVAALNGAVTELVVKQPVEVEGQERSEA